MNNKNTFYPDSSWKGFYKAGVVSAILYILFALIVPFFIFINHTQLIGMVNGTKFMNYILENGTTWWIILQSFLLCENFLQ